MLPDIQIGIADQEVLSHKLELFREAVLTHQGVIQLVVHPYAIDNGEIYVDENGEVDPQWINYLSRINETLDSVRTRSSYPTIILSEQGMSPQDFSKHFGAIISLPDALCITTNNGDPVPYTEIQTTIRHLHNTLFNIGDWSPHTLQQISCMVGLALPSNIFDDNTVQDEYLEEADRRFVELRQQVNILAWNQLSTFLKDLGVKHVKLTGRNLFIKSDGSTEGCIAEVVTHLEQHGITTELTDTIYSIQVTEKHFEDIDDAA